MGELTLNADLLFPWLKQKQVNGEKQQWVNILVKTERNREAFFLHMHFEKQPEDRGGEGL